MFKLYVSAYILTEGGFSVGNVTFTSKSEKVTEAMMLQFRKTFADNHQVDIDKVAILGVIKLEG